VIGYRISAGSPIGRSPRTVAAPARQLRLICYVKTSIASIPSLVSHPPVRALSHRRPPPCRAPLARHPPRLATPSTVLDIPPPPPTDSARDRRRNGTTRTRQRGSALFFFIGAVRRCPFVRPGVNALSKKWPVEMRRRPFSSSTFLLRTSTSVFEPTTNRETIESLSTNDVARARARF
jgi:hypothetical protein